VTSYKNPNLGDRQFDMVLIALFSSKISQNTDDIVIKTKSTVFFSLHKSKTFLAFKMKHEKKKALQKQKPKNCDVCFEDHLLPLTMERDSQTD